MQVGLSLKNIVNYAGDLLTTRPVTDPYTASLAAIPGCSVQKAILDPLRRKPHDAEFCDYTVHSTNSLASLPYPDACVDIVSARSLHKGVQYRLSGTDMAHNQELKDMRDCLAECHRLLEPGGRLEYIFFQDGLINTGPLTTEIEHFLKEVWGHKMEDGTVCTKHICSVLCVMKNFKTFLHD
jgi:hypothetical protein